MWSTLKLSALGVVVVFLLIFGGAYHAAHGQAATPTGKVLRIAAGDVLPDHLDPHRNSWNAEIVVSLLDYEGLTKLDEASQTVPAAAESWEYSDDNLTLTFHLRDGLTYSDGSPLTAGRFRYAIQRSCDPFTAAPYASILFPIAGCEALNSSVEAALLSGGPDALPVGEARAAYESALAGLGVEAPDDRTLVFHLNQPAAYLPTIAYTWVFYPVKQEIVEANPDGWWLDPASRIGNGPFRAVRFETDGEEPRLIFAANEHYWAGRPKLDGIEYVYGLETTEEAVEAYRRGDLDIAWAGSEMIQAVEADPDLSADLVRYSLADTMVLSFHLGREPFQDKKVREAFAYAFDREAYCDEVGKGTCVPAYSWIPPGTPGAIETDAYAFDPAKAREALAASSYGGPENLPEITLVYVPDWPDSVAEAEWLVEQYRTHLGVEISLEPVTPDDLFGLFSTPETWPHLAFWGWTQDYPDPQNWISITWGCDSTMFAGMVGYCNETVDELIDRADAEPNPEERMALYEEAGRLIVDDAAVAFRSHTTTVVLVKPYVTGYATTPRDHWPGMASLLTIDLAVETVPPAESTPAA